MPDWATDAPDVTSEQIWEWLASGQGAWRTPVLASVDTDLGCDARTVVLRDCQPGQRELVFYSARDADKVLQFKRDSRCCMLVHDAERDVQVRMYGHCFRVQDEDVLSMAWQALAEHQQRLYSLQRRVRGKENFAAFRVVIHAMHYLELDAQGYNEAIEFRWNENAAGDAGGSWESQRVEP